MPRISIEKTPSEAGKLENFLDRMLNRINIALGDDGVMAYTDVLPLNPVVGKIYYYTDKATGGIDEGFYGYTKSGWKKLHD